jgi:RsiW-degrading membrane proteinase PrsW (M82 family)
MFEQYATTFLAIPFGHLAIAFFGGLIPVLIWLIFLEHEDIHREPKKLILLAFISGMVTVVFIVPFENLVATIAFPTVIVIWAIMEEVAKYLTTYITVLWRKENDEPIDSMIYMIATALGFAGVENAFFILQPVLTGHSAEAFITGDLRFLGATLLHVVSSSIVGAGLSLSFYSSKKVRAAYIIVSLLLASGLHSLFNFSIMIHGGTLAIFAFYSVWAAVAGILLFFEKAKIIKPTNIINP